MNTLEVKMSRSFQCGFVLMGRIEFEDVNDEGIEVQCIPIVKLCSKLIELGKQGELRALCILAR